MKPTCFKMKSKGQKTRSRLISTLKEMYQFSLNAVVSKTRSVHAWTRETACWGTQRPFCDWERNNQRKHFFKKTKTARQCTKNKAGVIDGPGRGSNLERYTLHANTHTNTPIDAHTSNVFLRALPADHCSLWYILPCQISDLSCHNRHLSGSDRRREAPSYGYARLQPCAHRPVDIVHACTLHRLNASWRIGLYVVQNGLNQVKICCCCCCCYYYYYYYYEYYYYY